MHRAGGRFSAWTFVQALRTNSLRPTPRANPAHPLLGLQIDPSERNRVGPHRMHGGKSVSGDGPNPIYGSGSEDRSYGKGGADVIDSRGGADELYGGDGPEAGLYGGNGWNLVRGGAREDKAIGGWGADTMRGGRGLDICYVVKYDRVKGCERKY